MNVTIESTWQKVWAAVGEPHMTQMQHDEMRKAFAAGFYTGATEIVRVGMTLEGMCSALEAWDREARDICVHGK